MKNNKYFYKIAGLVLVIGLLVTIVGVTIDKSSASLPPALGSYLSGINGNDWVVMAQGALGQIPADINFLKVIDGSSVNDYATYILALTSLGIDPRYFGSENLVGGLRQKTSNGQLGDETLINDDMFGLIALVSAGVPASDSLVQSEASYIKSKQLPDGSWDFSANSTVGSVDMTAVGIMALRAGGVGVSDSSLTKAVSYLAGSQKDDGGWPMLAGGNSNTESTAWALSALYALGDNPDFWAPLDSSPVDYLLAQIQSDGHAGFDSSSQNIGSRTPTTTAYAAIALSGKYYPIKVLPSPTSVNIRIEGKETSVCAATVDAHNALDAVKAASPVCNFTYHIKDTQYGPYLDKINNDEAVGLVGWSFLINNQSLQVGANDYLVKANDDILVYYGNWDDFPLRITSSNNNPAIGVATTITVEMFNYNTNAWVAAGSATVRRSSESLIADASGRAILSWPQAGVFEIWAQEANVVRSSKLEITVGSNSSARQSLGMSVDIQQQSSNTPPPNNNNNPPSGGSSQNNAPAPPTIVFGVSGDLNFGVLSPGARATKTATISNNGTVNITTTASVSGAEVFKKNLVLDSEPVPGWQKKVNAKTQSPVNVSLTVPASYMGSGREQGSLIFWANLAP